MKTLIGFSLIIGCTIANAEIKGGSPFATGETQPATVSQEPSLNQLYECARASSPDFLSINKSGGLVQWKPKTYNSFNHDSQGIDAVSLWVPAGEFAEDSGFVTVSEKKILFTKVKLEQNKYFKDTMQTDLTLTANLVPGQSFDSDRLTFSHNGRYSSAYPSLSRMLDTNAQVISIKEDDALFGEQAIKAKKLVEEKLRARLEKSVVALQDYSKLLSRNREESHMERMPVMIDGGVRYIEMPRIERPERKRISKDALDQHDARTFRLAYCGCEDVFPKEIAGARQTLTGSQSFMPIRDGHQTRRLNAEDLRCSTYAP